MKKILIGTLVGLLILTGCSSNDAPTTSQDFSTTQDVNPSDESGYIQAIKSLGNDVLAYGSTADLLEMGYNACNALDGGETVISLATKLTATQDTTAGQEAAYAVIAGAVVYLCPEYKYQADALGA